MLRRVSGHGAVGQRHRLTAEQRAGVPARIRLPASRPELNPAARGFEELRRRTAGRTDATVADTQAVVDPDRAELAADPARVRRRCGRDRLTAALDALPTAEPPPL